MSTGTSLVTVKTALVDAFTARAGLAGVQVCYGFPDDEISDESIWLQEATSQDAIPVMKTGTKKIEEQYSVTVACQVLRSEGESQQVADTRAAELLAEVQQTLAETPRLVPDIMWAELDGWRHHVGQLPKGEGHGSRFDVQVKVRARLYPQ